MQPVLLSKRKFISVIFMALLVICAVLMLLVFGRGKPALKIGLLHSLTGTMASSEKPLVEMLQFALEEVNTGGGDNDQLLQTVSVDCHFDVVCHAGRPLDPTPFPFHRLRDERKRLLQTADGNLS